MCCDFVMTSFSLCVPELQCLFDRPTLSMNYGRLDFEYMIYSAKSYLPFRHTQIEAFLTDAAANAKPEFPSTYVPILKITSCSYKSALMI